MMTLSSRLYLFAVPKLLRDAAASHPRTIARLQRVVAAIAGLLFVRYAMLAVLNFLFTALFVACVAFAVGAYTGSKAAHKAARASWRAEALQKLTSLTSGDLRSILDSELPPWLRDSEYERTQWFNTAVGACCSAERLLARIDRRQAALTCIAFRSHLLAVHRQGHR
jgi:hypothetical protein